METSSVNGSSRIPLIVVESTKSDFVQIFQRYLFESILNFSDEGIENLFVTKMDALLDAYSTFANNQVYVSEQRVRDAKTDIIEFFRSDPDVALNYSKLFVRFCFEREVEDSPYYMAVVRFLNRRIDLNKGYCRGFVDKTAICINKFTPWFFAGAAGLFSYGTIDYIVKKDDDIYAEKDYMVKGIASLALVGLGGLGGAANCYIQRNPHLRRV